MAKKVENKDLFSDDLFKSTTQDVEKLIIELDKLEQRFIEIAKVQKKILQKADTKTIEGIRQTNSSIEKLNETEKAALKLRRDKERLEGQLSALRKREAQEVAELQILKREQTRLNKQEIQENKAIVGAYTAQSARLNRLRREYKDLAISKGTTSKEAVRLRKEIIALDGRLKSIDKSVGQAQRNVGNYGSAWERVGSTLRTGLGALGITAGIAGIARVITSSIAIFKDFEAANSKLQSVLGATTSEMKSLSDQAKELGASTAFTASQVTELQTEFAKLGFPTNEILNMTESTLAASAAMGSGLGEQAALTGATLKAFQLSSKEAARVNDVLAKSTARSALDFSKLNTAMSTIAPVANAMGFSVEDTVALLGNLSDSGFDASTAATATRNIMLKLADSSSVLGKRLKEPVKDLPSLIKGLRQLTDEGIDLSGALELTDVRSVAAFNTFLKGTDSLEKLSNELNNAKGAAQEMADVMLNNLSGDITKAQSAWEGFILDIEDGNGRISRALRGIVQSFTQLLDNFKLDDRADELGLTRALFQDFGEGEKSVFKLDNALGKFRKQLRESEAPAKSYRAAMKAINEQMKTLDRSTELGNARYIVLRENLIKLGEDYKALSKSQKETTQVTEKDTEATKENTKAHKERNNSLKREREEYKKLQKEINDITVGKLKEQEVDDSSILKMKKRLDEEAHAREMERQRQLDNEKKLIEQRKELTEAALEVLGTMLEEYHKKELEGIDRQLDATEKRVDQLRKRAELGQLEAQESLAFEEKKQAELEQQRLKAQKRQQREQALFTVISTYQQKLASNDPNPLLSTLKDIAVLKSFASTLAGFYDGTDEVEKDLGKPQLKGRDGYIVRVDGKEQVWSKKDRADVGFRSRDEIKEIVGMVDSGMLNQMTNRDMFNPNAFVLNGLIDKKALTKLDAIERAVKQIDIPEGMVKIDEVRGLINLYSRKANKVVVERSKLFK